MPADMRTCRTCGETKPIDEFDVRADTGRYRTHCRACRRSYQNARRAKTRPQREAQPRRVANSEVVLRCSHCGVRKPAAEFPPIRRGQPELQAWCRSCFAEANASNYPAYYARERTRITKRAREHREEIQLRIIEYLRAHPCVDCGETDIVVLEFDHVESKRANVTRFANGGRSWALIASEIAKCEVRCANCHRRKTEERRGTVAMPAAAPTTGEPARALQLLLDSAFGLRECRVCHVTKTVLEFPFRSIAAQTHAWICHECQRIASRAWYETNRGRHATNARRSGRRAKERARGFVKAHLSVHACVDCGEHDITVLDFDHLRDKTADISTMVRQGRSIDEIAREIAKCEVRCVNCHRRKTCERIDAYRIRSVTHALGEAA